MTLARTALRLAVIEALAPHALVGAANATWPTFADDRVRDSIIELDAEPYDERGRPSPARGSRSSPTRRRPSSSAPRRT